VQNVGRISTENNINMNIGPAVKGPEMTVGMLFYIVIGLIVIIGIIGM
jgi:hypothetical protein